MGLPVVSRGVVKESLMDTLGTGDNDWASTVSRAAHGVMYGLIDDLGTDVILEAHFHRGVAERTLGALGRQLIQLYCRCPGDVAWERYQARRDDPDGTRATFPNTSTTQLRRAGGRLCPGHLT